MLLYPSKIVISWLVGVLVKVEWTSLVGLQIEFGERNLSRFQMEEIGF